MAYKYIQGIQYVSFGEKPIGRITKGTNTIYNVYDAMLKKYSNIKSYIQTYPNVAINIAKNPSLVTNIQNLTDVIYGEEVVYSEISGDSETGICGGYADGQTDTSYTTNYPLTPSEIHGYLESIYLSYLGRREAQLYIGTIDSDGKFNIRSTTTIKLAGTSITNVSSYKIEINIGEIVAVRVARQGYGVYSSGYKDSNLATIDSTTMLVSQRTDGVKGTFYYMIKPSGESYITDYTELEYLGFEGNNYVDLGIMLTQSNDVAGKFEIPSTQTNSDYTHNILLSANVNCSLGNANKKYNQFAFYLPSNGKGGYVGSLLFGLIEFTWTPDSKILKNDGEIVDVSVQDAINVPDNTSNLIMMHSGHFDNTSVIQGRKNFMYLKVGESGTFTYHFIPVLKDGVPMVYDKINKSYIAIQGTNPIYYKLSDGDEQTYNP